MELLQELIKQVPETEEDEGLNKRTDLLTFFLCSHFVHALTKCSLAPSYGTPMKQCQSHQCLLHFGIDFSAACDTVVHSLFHGKFLVSPDITFSQIPCPFISDLFFSSFSVFFPTSKYCRDPKLNIGLLSLQFTISIDDLMQSFFFF